MYYRRKVLLNLIAAFGDQGLSRIKLQKLLFLFCQKRERAAFDFVPYRDGCYSFQAAQDLHVLATHYQLLREAGNGWIINSGEIPALKAPEQQLVTGLVASFKGYDDSKITGYVDGRYPYFSINSEWRMTSRQTQARQKEKEKIARQNDRVLFTLGYEGRSIDDYLNRLIENNISLLCDVRRNALSMKYGFSQNQLSRCCENLGIVYEHIPDLGIPSAKRRQIDSPADRLALFAEYSESLPLRETALDQVLELLRKHGRIALTCFESEPRQCHRHCISEYLYDSQRVVYRDL